MNYIAIAWIYKLGEKCDKVISKHTKIQLHCEASFN